MMDFSSRSRDLLGACLASGLGLASLRGTDGMSELGAVFPTAAAAVLLLSGFWLGARALLSRPISVSTAPIAWARVVGVMAVFIVWALTLNLLGFVIASAFGITAMALVAVRERLSAQAAIMHGLAGILLIALFYSLFGTVLRVPLP